MGCDMAWNQVRIALHHIDGFHHLVLQDQDVCFRAVSIGIGLCVGIILNKNDIQSNVAGVCFQRSSRDCTSINRIGVEDKERTLCVWCLLFLSL